MKKLLIYFLLPLLILACKNDSDDVGYSGGIVTGENTERYNDFEENPFLQVAKVPVSTFSIDADGGSYSNVRRMIEGSLTPPAAAVRVEDFINYFTYDYPDPTDGNPIGLNGEVSACPWNAQNKLIRIGIKGKTIAQEALPAGNLVLLIDVSGSMQATNKLELLKAGLISFVNQMRPQDKIAIVTYAGQAGVALESTLGTEKEKIVKVIQGLESGGSTAGAQGITKAYEIAQKNFVEGGNNRVILGTDGDFNVGVSSQEELVKLIESMRDKGIFLTTLGVGEGNLNEGMLEQVADKGNGNYEYIDNLEQSDKVFIKEYQKFYTVAKDVKIQITFNPTLVESYRLIGYENRLLKDEDFEDDTKDAGEIGASQTITALYEIKTKSSPLTKTDPTIEINFRFKNPDEEVSKEMILKVIDEGKTFESASESLRFASSVAGFGMLLRESKYKGTLTYDQVINWATAAKTYDPNNYRSGFVTLVGKAKK